MLRKIKSGEHNLKKDAMRQISLLEMLSEKKRLDIRTVVEALSISEATARRLFTDLEKSGKLIRTHGGIQAAPEIAPDYSFRLSSVLHTPEKNAIGAAAARHVNSGDRIYLDSGTTVLKMADALASRIRHGEICGVSIVTNSLSCMDNLSELTEVILTGGIIRPSRRDACGPLAEKNLAMYHFDKAFLGADAISSNGDLLTTDDRTAIMNEVVIRNSGIVFILADSSKFGGKAFVTYANLRKIKTIIISDENMSRNNHNELRAMNIKTEVAVVKN